jgi:acetyl esterase
MQAVLDALAAARAGLPNRYELPYPQARTQLLAERRPWLDDGPPCARAERTVQAEGRRVAVRTYRPGETVGERFLVYFHGGGWCVGSPETHDNIVRRLATTLGCEAWSVDYALAPEAPHPEGLLDCVAAVRAAAAAHPEARLVLAGDSAGAHLALMTALHVRNGDEAARLGARPSGGEPRLDALLLFYGVYTDAVDDASMAAYGDGRYGLSKAAHVRYLDACFGPVRASAASGARARGTPEPPAPKFPLDRRVDLAGLPDTWLTVAELDILHDQSHALAAALRAAGVAVQVDDVPGVIHGFLSYGRVLPQAAAALEAAAAWVRSRR